MVGGGLAAAAEGNRIMQSTHVLEIGDANFEDEVSKSALPVVLDFWGVGCGPCARFAPVFADAAERHAGKVLFGKVNAHESHVICAEFQVMALPTIVFLREGKEVMRYRGAMSGPAFEERLAEAFGG